MKKILILLIIVHVSFVTYAQHIIPTPTKVDNLDGIFTFKSNVKVGFEQLGEQTVNYFISHFSKNKVEKIKHLSTADIVFKTINDKTIGKEGYLLEITSKQIIVSANTETGLFYGIQSLLQLLPANVAVGKSKLAGIQIPCIMVKDSPKYAWRSFMLDSGRQYQTPEFIKKYLNHMPC